MPVDRIKELVQEGLRRKLSGDLQGAADVWQEALLLDPANERALAGLESLAKLGLQAPSDPLKPGVTPAMGLLFTPPSVVVQGSLRKNPFARPDRPERKSEPVPMTPSPFEATRAPLSLLVRDGIEISAAEAPPNPASSQTLVFGFTPPEEPKQAEPSPSPSGGAWIDISEALGAVEEVVAETMGPLFFGEESAPQTQSDGLGDPIRGLLSGDQEPGDPSGATEVQFPSPAFRVAVPLPSSGSTQAQFPPGPRAAPAPVAPASPLGATPPQFPAPLGGFGPAADLKPEWSTEALTLDGLPEMAEGPEPEAASPEFEERFPTPEPSAPLPPLAPESPEPSPDSPFPMTPRPFTLKMPVPPGGTLAQFGAPAAPEPGLSTSPFPRTPRPFEVEVFGASGRTNVQFPAPSSSRAGTPEACEEAGSAAASAPGEELAALPFAEGVFLSPEEDLPAEIEIEVDLDSSSEAGEPEGPDIGGLLLRAADLLDLDDHTGALKTVEEVLAIDPQNATAHELLERCESTLLAMFESKLGDLSYRPRVKLKPDEIVWLNLDHRAGFVLSLVDGQVSYDDLFALSSMSRLDTARILVHLLQAQAIG